MSDDSRSWIPGEESLDAELHRQWGPFNLNDLGPFPLGRAIRMTFAASQRRRSEPSVPSDPAWVCRGDVRQSHGPCVHASVSPNPHIAQSGLQGKRIWRDKSECGAKILPRGAQADHRETHTPWCIVEHALGIAPV
jgi:hypothetical protein